MASVSKALKVLIGAGVILSAAAISTGTLVAGASGSPASPVRTAVTAGFAPQWGKSLAVDSHAGPAGGLTAVSCSGPTFCAAVDVNGNALQFNGRTWSRPKSVDAAVYGLESVSCPTRNFCVASDGNGFVLTWIGSRWSPPHSVDPSTAPPSLGLIVSCPTTSFCAGVDSYGDYVVWRGKAWSQGHLFDQYGNAIDFSDLSCSSATFCAAVAGGDVLYWNGSTWSKQHVIDGLGPLSDISCLGPSFCAAGGDGVLVYNGKRWSAPDSISALTITSISCSTAHDCIAGDEVGDTFFWNGSRWASGKNIAADNALSSISCPTTSFCAVVTTGGDAVFYARVPAVTTKGLPDATRSKRYSTRVTAAGGTAPYRWSTRSRLPRGLTLSSQGVLAGTPGSTGKFSVVVQVSDPLGESSHRTLELVVR